MEASMVTNELHTVVFTTFAVDRITLMISCARIYVSSVSEVKFERISVHA